MIKVFEQQDETCCPHNEFNVVAEVQIYREKSQERQEEERGGKMTSASTKMLFGRRRPHTHDVNSSAEIIDDTPDNRLDMTP